MFTTLQELHLELEGMSKDYHGTHILLVRV